MNAPLSILRVGVVSPLGIGFDAFSQALRAPRQPDQRGTGARRIDSFDAAQLLGSKGTSTLDRMTQLAIVATGQVLAGAQLPAPRRGAAGIVLGSTSGGLGSIAGFVRTTYTAAQPHLVSPMLFPNTVMNCAAGQAAIWHGLKGTNASVCAGDLSGMAALQYAARMLHGGHAQDLVAGAVEEHSDFIEAMHRAQPGASVPFAEGGAVFLLRRDAEPGTALAAIHGMRVRVLRDPADPGRAQAALARAVASLLADARVRGADLRWWSGHGHSSLAVQRAVLDGLDAAPALAALPDSAVERCGDSAGAGTALQLAAALALAPQGLGLLTAISPQGMLGCMLVDKHSAERQAR